MNEVDRAASAAASQAARASLSLRMQVDPTATAPKVLANSHPKDNMEVASDPSQTDFTASSAESVEEGEWEEVQSTSAKKIKRKKRKADQAGINTPNSPFPEQQEPPRSKSESPGNRKSPTEKYQPKSYLPSATLNATLNGEAVDMRKVSPVAIAKYLEPLVSKEAIKKVTPHPNDGSLTVTTTTEGYLTEVLQITKLGPWDIDARTFSRSTCIGVIEGVHPLVTKEEISKEIYSQVPIKSAERIIRKGGAATACVKILFEGPTLPQEVRLGFNIHSVRKFIPEAIQCFKCRYFGHIASGCRAKQRCARCGENHITKDCKIERGSYKCANCGGPHSSAYGGCRERKKAQQIIQTAVMHDIPRKEAARAIESGVSFASIVAGGETASKQQQQPRPSQPDPPPVSQTITARETDLEAKFNLILELLVEVIGSLAANGDPAIGTLVSTAKSILEKSAPTGSSEAAAPAKVPSPKRSKKRRKRAKKDEESSNPERKDDDHTDTIDISSRHHDVGTEADAESSEDLYSGLPPPMNK